MILELERAIAKPIEEKYATNGPVVACTVDDLTKYKNLSAKGAVLVRYTGANYVRNGNQLVRNWRFMILIGTKKFTQHGSAIGAYEILDDLRNLLTGRRVMPELERNVAIKLIPESEGFLREQANVWWFHITFTGTDVLLTP